MDVGTIVSLAASFTIPLTTALLMRSGQRRLANNKSDRTDLIDIHAALHQCKEDTMRLTMELREAHADAREARVEVRQLTGEKMDLLVRLVQAGGK